MIGTRLGPYEIIEAIGAGGMGEVYRAIDTRLGRTVAIKILNKEHMQRIEREARAIAALSHNNICTLYDVGPDYLVMEYIDGAAIKGPLPVEEAVRLAIQIAGALDEAHKRGILHRDLKPGNIMVTSSGAAKLLDFGLAKLGSGTENETASTMDGAVVGTPAYMSPEQAQGMPVDARSDIFSFGAVLYEIISGNRPFEGRSTVQVLSAVLRDEPKPLPTSPQLECIVMRCLAKQPGQRFQTIAEVKNALEQISVKQAEKQPSIAVLPFVNMSGDKEQEYFSDGLAEEIINALAQIPGLKVIARTSAFAFRGKEQDITKIAEALRVRTILEGSVRKSGNRIRITAQLIDASDGSHLWSERYDREMADVFLIQDQISQAIAEKLRLKLMPDLTLVKRYTENAQAYDLYLIGHYHFLRFTPEGFAKCKDCCERALALDPSYALAWCQLAEVYRLSGILGLMRSKTASEQCRQTAEKALKLDETLAYAHAVTAVVRAGEFDWRAAESEFRRALELQPESEDAITLYCAYYLIPMQRTREALALAQRALERNPLSPSMLWGLGRFYCSMQFYDQAAEQYRKALEIDPHYWPANLDLGPIHILTGNIDQGILAIERSGMLEGNMPIALGVIGCCYAFANRVEEAKKILESLYDQHQKMSVPAISFAMVYLGLGEIDKTFDWIEKAVEGEPDSLLTAMTSPFFNRLHSHPRYQTILRKMKLDNLLETSAL
jgi:eukaryotic-like serine/threonine-protein kinase